MPRIDKHPPGTFCWIELFTTGQNGAKTFYSSLFGWSSVDSPMGPGEFYTMFQIDGRDAAGAYTMGADERSQGVPPHWNLYVAVESADDAAGRAAKLGGEVLAPAFDVMEYGRMAVLRDPTGAVISVWQANKHRGTGIGGVDGTLCWADLFTRDPERARQFYGDLFGWKLTVAEKDSSGYLHIQNGEEFIGGIPPGGPPNPKAPPHWLLYFQVADVDASAAKAKQLGAAVYAPPMTIENAGRIAVLADPAGAAFSIFKASPRS
jgi:predicted enzyme related to lactoylglutathione lyase